MPDPLAELLGVDAVLPVPPLEAILPVLELPPAFPLPADPNVLLRPVDEFAPVPRLDGADDDPDDAVFAFPLSPPEEPLADALPLDPSPVVELRSVIALRNCTCPFASRQCVCAETLFCELDMPLLCEPDIPALPLELPGEDCADAANAPPATSAVVSIRTLTDFIEDLLVRPSRIPMQRPSQRSWNAKILLLYCGRQ